MPAFVQSAQGAWVSGTTYTITFATNPGAGALVVVAFDTRSGWNVSSVSGLGATWTGRTFQNDGLNSSQIYEGRNCSGASAVITVTMQNAGLTHSRAVALEFSGMKTSSVFDAQNGTTGSSSTASTSVTSTAAGVVVASVAEWNQDINLTPASPWVVVASGFNRMGVAYRINAAGAVNTSTWGFMNPANFGISAAAFFSQPTPAGSINRLVSGVFS